MRAEVVPPDVLISGLDKRMQYARQEQLTGIWAINTDLTHQWRLYFLAGQLVWANTRIHAKRRWYRQLGEKEKDIKVLSWKFQVSVSAMAIRLSNLGLTDDYL